MYVTKSLEECHFCFIHVFLLFKISFCWKFPEIFGNFHCKKKILEKNSKPLKCFAVPRMQYCIIVHTMPTSRFQMLASSSLRIYRSVSCFPNFWDLPAVRNFGTFSESLISGIFRDPSFDYLWKCF